MRSQTHDRNDNRQVFKKHQAYYDDLSGLVLSYKSEWVFYSVADGLDKGAALAVVRLRGKDAAGARMLEVDEAEDHEQEEELQVLDDRQDVVKWGWDYVVLQDWQKGPGKATLVTKETPDLHWFIFFIFAIFSAFSVFSKARSTRNAWEIFASSASFGDELFAD